MIYFFSECQRILKRGTIKLSGIFHRCTDRKCLCRGQCLGIFQLKYINTFQSQNLQSFHSLRRKHQKKEKKEKSTPLKLKFATHKENGASIVTACELLQWHLPHVQFIASACRYDTRSFKGHHLFINHEKKVWMKYDEVL